MNASSISRLLRESGLRPIPSGSNREGIKVRGGTTGNVWIRLDFDHDSGADRSRPVVRELLEAAGYTVRDTSERVLEVTR